MSVQERIDSDLKEAMRAKDSARLAVLRMLKAALKNSAIEKGGADVALSDADVNQIIRKQVKQREDSVASFEKGGRPELAQKESDEIAVLQQYLPQPLNAEEIQKLVRDTIAELNAATKAQMGAVMKAVQAKAGGSVDGKTLSQEVQRQLQ